MVILDSSARATEQLMPFDTEQKILPTGHKVVNAKELVD